MANDRLFAETGVLDPDRTDRCAALYVSPPFNWRPTLAGSMNGILNETTNRVHKHENGRADFQTVCGELSHVSHEQLQRVSVEQAVSGADVSTCEHCFSNVSGY
jgi:hypothetical protein